jgi:hypothetical protein
MPDLFADVFPVRAAPAPLSPAPFDLGLRVKTAMGRALAECGRGAHQVAADMNLVLGLEPGDEGYLTVDALYAMTAPSKRTHQVSVVRLVAFTRATGATWIWDDLLAPEGLMVMEGREARLAELGRLRQEKDRLAAREREIADELKRAPVSPRPRGRA